VIQYDCCFKVGEFISQIFREIIFIFCETQTDEIKQANGWQNVMRVPKAIIFATFLADIVFLADCELSRKQRMLNVLISHKFLMQCSQSN